MVSTQSDSWNDGSMITVLHATNTHQIHALETTAALICVEHTSGWQLSDHKSIWKHDSALRIQLLWFRYIRSISLAMLRKILSDHSALYLMLCVLESRK